MGTRDDAPPTYEEAARARSIRNAWALSAPALFVLLIAASGPLLIVLVFAGVLLQDRLQLWYYNPARTNPDKALVLLTTQWCPYCTILRQSLQQSNIPFRELDVETSKEGRFAFHASGARSIPVTLIGQQYVSGGLAPQLKAISDAGYPVVIAFPERPGGRQRVPH